MGLQSLSYYVTLTWLPEILQAEGDGCSQSRVDARALSGRGDRDNVLGSHDRREEALSARRRWVAVGMSGVGALGLLVAGSTASTLWVVLLGLGQGAAFSLALTFRAACSGPGHAAALSGMAQSVGYLLAAGGPFLFGVLRDVTGTWRVPLALLLTVTICLLIAGIGAARDAHVGASAPEEAG